MINLYLFLNHNVYHSTTVHCFLGKRKAGTEIQDEEAWEELYWKIGYNGCQDLLEKIQFLERKPAKKTPTDLEDIQSFS